MLIQQSIVIQQIRIGSISNASIVQIGTTGTWQAYADLNNTGQFKGVLDQPEFDAPIVPLAPPSM
ncbi:spore germination protein GerPB [Amphibacillus cookii]|uniref:spore germination protein GerPB n=1 Tax=Amphibacillus cookii TaxID=767787 RepID=UPI00195BDEF6|nr:spore germination protein GerPB [Amphibacillus cookii]MBM7540147.1 spore germination protein PB [Amphibacillus cookii]